ncbi:MAG: 3-hydroxybutyryl-CoA dehydrogenase [Actinomycetes bacterium]
MREEQRNLGVLGCGLMGSGIAEVCARSSCEVVVVEADATAASRGRDKVMRSLESAAARGKLSDADHEAAVGRLDFTHDWDAFADRSLVIEAIAEDPAAKVEAFQRLAATVADPLAILASNTSSIPIMKLATATSRPEQVVGLHFFNPVPVLPLVELVPSLMTSAEVEQRATEFASATLGKHVVRSQDRAGFLVNALLSPYLRSAIRMLESGFATAADIDTGMVQGCAHPMGPLALADLIGLDTTMAVAQSMYAEFKEPLYASPPLLSRMVEAGLLGRKTGRGFHDYSGRVGAEAKGGR